MTSLECLNFENIRIFIYIILNADLSIPYYTMLVIRNSNRIQL